VSIENKRHWRRALELMELTEANLDDPVKAEGYIREALEEVKKARAIDQEHHD